MDLFVATTYGVPNALYRNNGASGGFTKMDSSEVGDVVAGADMSICFSGAFSYDGASVCDNSHGAAFADFDGGLGRPVCLPPRVCVQSAGVCALVGR